MLNSLLFVAIARAEATVSGSVTLPNGHPAFQAIVVFEGKEKSKPMPKAMVDQRDRSFLPHVSVITVGTKVDFPNNDVVFHNVFTEFHSSKFDLGMYPKGTSKSQTFRRPGLAVIMCSVHPDMGAYVMVVDTPFYAVTDKRGRYQIAGLPEGHYNVTVWHESGAKATLSTDVGSAVNLDIPIRR
jgi:plastocyanin